MLQIASLEKSFGGHELFRDVSLQMSPGERLGLVGRNGSGKSTLFRILLGEMDPDDGQVVLPRGYRVGHLEQHLKFTKPTVLEEACLGLREGEEDYHYKAERILFGLGFSEEDMARAPAEFSGGFQIRINLAKVLVSEPNLLLLDEPTNYLDILSIRWMTRFLNEWENEVILISHDREFMDSVSTHTAIIHRGKLRKITGGTEKLYAQILQDEEIHEKTRQNQQKKLDKEMAFIERFRAQASKASSVQSRVKRLEKMPSLEKLAHIDHLDFSFHEAPFEADRMMELRNVGFHYENGPPLMEELNFMVQSGDRLAVIGKNGKGKSTFLRVLAGELKPTAGEIYGHPNLKPGYFGQTNINRLQNSLTVEKEIGQSNPDLGLTAIRSICGTMMFSGDAAEKKISVLSGGEKSRVLLGKILAQPCNLLLLDEPTNHLDMESIEALLESLRDFAGAVIIVTHSEMILKDLATKLVIFHRGRADYFPGTYDEFLDKIGWEEEGEKKKENREKGSGGINKKELRKRRSEIITERSKILSPLKKEMANLEAKIVSLEAQLADAKAELLAAVEGNKAEAMVTCNQRIKSAESAIESTFFKLGELNARHETENKRFEDALAQLEGR